MTLNQTIQQTNTSPMCDWSIKQLFGDPYIISILAKETLPIYKSYTVQEIRDSFVLDEINIGDIAVDQDEVLKLNNEDKSKEEGTIYFDVLTILRNPNSDKIGLFLNIEGQKELDPGYDLINRAIYYSARLLSRQKNKIWYRSDYDSLMKVISLWICYDPSKSYPSKMLRIHLNCDMEVGTLGLEEDIFDKMEIIMLQIGEDAHEQDSKILSFLKDLLSNQLTTKEKIEIFKNEYGIENSDLKERVTGMCNISAGYFEDGFNKGQKSGFDSGQKSGIEMGTRNSTLQHIQLIKESFHISTEQAMDVLKIPEEQRSYYRTH